MRDAKCLYPSVVGALPGGPEVALVPPGSLWRDALTVRRRGFALYRRIAEIHDAQLALRPHRDPQAAEAAATLARRAGLDRAAPAAPPCPPGGGGAPHVGRPRGPRRRGPARAGGSGQPGRRRTEREGAP